MKYVCELCGYLYRSEQGDPNQQVMPGTDFEDLPQHWVCPQCGAEKEDFEPLDDNGEYDISED